MENNFKEIVFLVLTIAIELPIVLLFLRKESRQRVILSVVGVNMISHPIVWWFIFSHGGNWFAAEGSVILFESVIFGILFPKNRVLAVLAGGAANILTATIGYVLF